MKEIHIYDLDGTVIDSSHRYRTITRPDGSLTIDFPYWVANKHKAFLDKLLPLAKQYQNQRRNPDTFVIVATARNMSEQEHKHVYSVLGWPDYMISRPDGDMRPGADLKIAGLRQILSLKQFAKIKDRTFYEDNLSYLEKVSNALDLKPVYIPSNQGY